MVIQERYKPVLMGVNASHVFYSPRIGGFLAKTAGTITVVDKTGTTLINAHPLTAGVYYPLPFYVGTQGGTVSLAGGASGTLGI